MITYINGPHYRNLIDYGIRNLTLYREQVNALNVFPVPDGDTGSNMVMTLQNGFAAIDGVEEELFGSAQRFSSAVVFGARGNSGVIISQFFKGFSERFFDKTEASGVDLAEALEQGVQYAYRAVSHPVEGTILTVLREATDHVRAMADQGEIGSVDDAVDAFLRRAKTSLEHTPELLPILKSAGVVDSGGAGIIYVFEGMQKYLRGETIEAPRDGQPAAAVDYSRFDRASVFEFGYCTELLIQLTDGKEPFDMDTFDERMSHLGDSIVTAREGDKIKLHIHSFTPEAVLRACHIYGEFLSLKIENMSVQHTEQPKTVEVSLSHSKCDRFSIVAVAHDPSMGQRFADMGADVVLWGDRHCPPSASDFLEAFEKAESDQILVFPNCKNTQLAAEQAAKLFLGAEITVFETRSDTECYAALPMVDFEAEEIPPLAEEIRRTVENIRTVPVTRATKNSCFDGREIRRDDYLAVEGNVLLSVEQTLTETACSVIRTVMEQEEREVLTLFTGRHVSPEDTASIETFVAERYPYTELSVIETEDDFYRLILSFE